MRRLARVLGAVLVTAGVLTLVWVVVVWQWQDPFTALYTHFEQARLSHTYERRAAEFHPHLARADLASSERRIAADARIYGRTLKVGDPVGRLRIGRIGLNMVVVQGTDHSTLKRGPGHYIGSGSARPGSSHLHRRPSHHVPGAVRRHQRHPDRRLRHLRSALRRLHLPCDPALRRSGDRALGAPRPRLGDPSSPGVSSALLRDASLHRRREARVGRADEVGYAVTMIGVPAGARRNSLRITPFATRMHPCEAARPIDHGSFVP